MRRIANRTYGPVIALVLGLTAVPPATLAHGEAGEHLENMAEHIGEYESDVQGLVKIADTIVEHHAADKDATGQIDKLVKEWKAVEVHAAIEKRATPLYAPVWSAISNLRAGIKNDVEADELASRRDALASALQQALGAVKLAANQDEQGGSKESGGHGDDHSDAGDHSAGAGDTIEHIVEALDKAAARYADGDAAGAKELVHGAYMQRFEGIEGELIERDADLVAGLEKDFNGTLPNLMDQGADVSAVEDEVAAMKDKLERAGKLLAEGDGDGEVF